MKDLVISVKEKIKKLLLVLDELKKENSILKKDVQEYKKQNEIMITKINNLTQKSDLLKINQSIESESDSNYTKKKIDQYIREIDKCINLIDNRNV
jgi:FtsZ-binding cell division protein ZapB